MCTTNGFLRSKTKEGRLLMLKIGIMLLILVFSLLSPLGYEALGVSCKCVFDTYEYTAVAEGEGYCSCTTKGGKHCSIVFNGNVKPTSKIEPSKYYGSVETYLAHLAEINRQLSQTHFQVVADKPDWVMNYLPLMVRSSYAVDPSIKHEERERLDNSLVTYFKSYPKEISDALMGKRDFFSREYLNVTKGKLDFTIREISVSMDIFIPKKF